MLSWSGGKDSAFALHTLRQDPTVEVVGLLTSVTRTFDRISVHGVRRRLLHAQVESLGLPLVEIELEAGSTNDAYEAGFRAALSRIERELPTVSHIAFGDLFLDDVRAYRERLLVDTRFDPLFPIWGLDTAVLAQRLIEEGFVAHLVCVDTTQLDGAFAGRAFDTRLLADLPASVDPCGENGEFHTFVSDGPPFRRAVNHVVGQTVLRDGRFMFCDLEESCRA